MITTDQAPTPQEAETKKLHRSRRLIYPAVLAVVLITTGAIIYNQHRQISSMRTKNDAVTLEATQLKKDKAQLSAKNTNLTESYKALKDSQKSATSTTAKTNLKAEGQTAAAPLPTASLEIDSVRVLPLSFFGNTNAYAKNTTRAVQVTMKNLSKSIQTYTIGDFQAITDKGEVIDVTVYTNDPGNGTFWNNSEIAPNGTIQEYLPFNVEKNIVTLKWAPAGSTAVYLAIPADQN